MLFFGQKFDKESVGQAGGQTLPYLNLRYFFAYVSCKDSYSYYVTFVWSCNVALCDISLYFVELGTCVVIRPSNRHALDMHSWLIHSHWFGLPILCL